MYVIKMRTIICYFAVFVITLSSVGIIRMYETENAVESVSETSPETASGINEQQNSALLHNHNNEKIDVPILMYHNVFRSSNRSGKYIISETGFEQDLKFLTENGYSTIVMKDLIDYVYDGKSLPEKPVVLTFDDGYFNNFSYVFPLLQKYNCKAVLSIIGYYTDMYSDSPDENPSYSHVTWDNVNKMIESGYVEMQNHSYNLHSTDHGRNGSKKKRGESLSEYKKVLKEDLGKLQEQFKTQTGYVPNTYTYPFGSVSNDSFDIIKEMGFKASLSCESGMNHISRDPECLYMMKRYIRTPSNSASEILK